MRDEIDLIAAGRAFVAFGQAAAQTGFAQESFLDSHFLGKHTFCPISRAAKMNSLVVAGHAINEKAPAVRTAEAS